MSDTILKVSKVKKYFGGVKALDGVDLEIKRGEIHCLAGENGCGKSTIINVISGYYSPDEGTIEIDGKTYEKLSPKLAIEKGIQVIYQDLSVFPNMTVMENLSINMELAEGRKIVSKKRMRKTAKEALSKINFQIDLDEYVENLSVADKQLIAISRALLYNAKLIIMDEPTTAITKKEVKALFEVIKKLQKENIAVLFVSHKLDEVFEIAERFTIFRNGKNSGSGLAEELTHSNFTYYMTGRKISEKTFEYIENKDAKTVLEVRNICLKNGFENINFSIKEGEILGITGLLGSGRTELVEAIFGFHKIDSGDIYIKGQKVKIESVKDGITNGLGYVPPERIKEGLFLSQSIADNITIEKWDEYSNRFGILNKNAMKDSVEKWINELSIKVHTPDAAVRTLSGGNQQKCVLAKWLMIDLNVLILNGPTVGVDIGAKYDIYELLKGLANRGLAIIIISDDLPEVLSNCNRVLVMRQGRIIAEENTKDLEASKLDRLSVED